MCAKFVPCGVACQTHLCKKVCVPDALFFIRVAVVARASMISSVLQWELVALRLFASLIFV